MSQDKSEAIPFGKWLSSFVVITTSPSILSEKALIIIHDNKIIKIGGRGVYAVTTTGAH